MEPLDPTRNVEGSGFSKRRISSILKAPRKSSVLSDPVQQENVVECTKPVDKRGSRRVSFAPANDVLLFSKDVKNGSPVRSPLQELLTATAATTQNRVQVAVTEDGGQITGMENLLSAPLHASQQRDKVCFDTAEDLGEKTVMFPTDDAFMDMTRCHTINMSVDAELIGDISLQNDDILPSGGEKRAMFTVDDGSVSLSTARNVDSGVEKRNISASVPCLDAGFENFLARVSSGTSTRMTPGLSSVDTNLSLAQSKTHTVNVDKENQVPAFVSTVMEKSSLNSTRKSCGLFPRDDVSMDMTETQTGCILGADDDDDDDDDGAFQCLFPSKEMHAKSDKKVSQTTRQQQSSKTFGPVDQTDRKSLLNFPANAPHPRHKVSSDECREKTIMFTADDEFMDMTRSHTVNIASGSLAPKQMPATSFSPGFKNFLASLSKPSDLSDSPVTTRTRPAAAPPSLKDAVDPCGSLFRLKTPRDDIGKENQSLNTSRSFGGTIRPEVDVSMDETEVQTGRITGPTGPDDVFPFLFPSQDSNLNCDSLKKTNMISGQQSSEAPRSSNHKGLGMETSLKPSLKTTVQRQDKLNVEDDYREKTVRFSADDACMDVTRSHTINIATSLEPKSHQNLDFFPSYGEKTVRFTASGAAMDMTQSLTVNIACNLAPDSVVSVNKQGDETCGSAGNRTSSGHSLDSGFLKTKMQRHQVELDSEEDFREKTVRFTAEDAAMDVTRSHTVNIATDLKMLSNTSVHMLPGNGEKTVRFSADDAAMDVTKSHTVNIAADFNMLPHQDVDSVPCNGEKTVRFSVDDAAMDVTRSHTVNIAADFNMLPHQDVDSVPCEGEKTVRFSVDDAAMEVTRSHTVNIATSFKPKSHQNVDFLPTCGEKTMRFTSDDAAMDVTKSDTVNIAADLNMLPQQNVDLLPVSGEKTVRNVDVLPASEEKTVRFSAEDAAMDVTQSHTVNIATGFEPKSCQNLDCPPTCGEKTVTFTADDADMDFTQCPTVNITTNLESDPVLLLQNVQPIRKSMDFPYTAKRGDGEICGLRQSRSSSAHGLDQTMSRTSGLWAKRKVEPTNTPFQESADTNYSLGQPTMTPDVDSENDPGLVSSIMEKSLNKTMTDCPEKDASMDMTEAQTSITGQTCPDDSLQCLSSAQDPTSENSKKVEETLPQSNEAPGSSHCDDVEIPNLPDPFDPEETETRKESEPITKTCPSSQKVESSPSAADKDADTLHSRKSRRMSLADLQSKLRRLSHIINTAPDAVDSCTAPSPQSDHDQDENSKDKNTSLPVVEPELEMGLANAEDNTQAQSLAQEEQPSISTTATPVKSKTKQLMSRLSVGGFKPKLPQRSKPNDPKKVNSAGEHTRTMTLNVTSQLNHFDNDVSDIYDEELGSCEDLSEMLDNRSPPKMYEKNKSSSQDSDTVEPLQDDIFEEVFISTVQGQKRPLPEDDIVTEDEKRMKASTEVVEMFDECDSNTTTARTTAHDIDSSNSTHTASSRCEATFESTWKHSLFESQLEDYGNDVQRKLEDGTITVLEFFKLFSINFVIHNPRQSVLSGRFLSDADITPMDLLKDRHISRPKQRVYESNVQTLSENVERLKVRMRDLDKPLKAVNRSLWEEMRCASEKELKTFGSKLKERNNFFRKTSKVLSHEMKEVLYSDLVQANLDEQQKLKGTVDKADEMIKTLDDCIRELETELTAVEEKGFENKPSLKSLQEEMKKVTESLAENEREISELEMEKKQSLSKIQRLTAETRNLERHVAMLHTVNEWKFKETRDNCSVYTFLYGTMQLQLVYEKSNGHDADSGFLRKITDISFNLELDDEKSQCHARLVHRLVSQYIEEESGWVEKYPTSRHVPKLLHDVGLVVSRCRLLGEELRLMKLWGGLRLDILHIRCVDSQVQIVFSSLRKCSKFEVVFTVGLTDRLYVLQLQSFRNMIGDTVVQQIEAIVALFPPAKNLLTKIVKKIHDTLLR